MRGLEFESFAEGRYSVSKKLGEGGKGIVYRCKDTSLERIVAVKLIKTVLDDTSKERFLREARTTARLSHPNIVSIYDMGVKEGHPFLVMEYLEGKDLEDFVLENGPLSASEIVKIASEIANALRYAHDEGVLHRDVKPGNIRISKKGIAKLMDFGLARSISNPKMTDENAIVGTPAYTAPESALGRVDDGRSDLYSLGCVMYFMATGKPPFDSEDSLKLIYSHINDLPKPIRQIRNGFPAELETVIMRLMAKDRKDRPDNTSELLRVLSTLEYDGDHLVREKSEVISHMDDLGSTATMYHGRSLKPLVGRKVQMQILKSHVDSARSGKGSMVLVVGERGTGKTRLLEESMIYASMRELSILSVKCNETKKVVPGQTISDIFKEYFGDKPIQFIYKICGDYADELVKILPEMASKLGRNADTPYLSPEQQNERYYEAVGGILKNIALEGPLLISLDDIQYMDHNSMKLLKHYSDFISSVGLCIMTSSTPIDEEPELLKTVTEAVRSHNLEVVEINNLGKEDTNTLLANFLEETVDKLPENFTDFMHRRTAGNPLFLEGTLKYLIDKMNLVPGEVENWEIDALTNLKLPSSIRNIIREKIESLDEGTLNILKIASVIGNEFDYETLKELCEIEDDNFFLEKIELLLDNKILLERKGNPGQVILAFADHQTRDILYEEISMIRRSTYHKRVAEIISRRSEGRPMDKFTVSTLSYHFLEGRDLPNAYQYCSKKANMWADSLDFREAAQTLDTCLEILLEIKYNKSMDNVTALEGDVHWRLARALGTFDLPRAENHIEQALEIFQKSGNEAGIIEISTEKVMMSDNPEYYYNIVNSIPDTKDNLKEKVHFYVHYAANINYYSGKAEKALSLIEENKRIAERNGWNLLLNEIQYQETLLTIIRNENDKNGILLKLKEIIEKSKNDLPLKKFASESGLIPQGVLIYIAVCYFWLKYDTKKANEEFSHVLEFARKRRLTSLTKMVEANRNYMVTLQTEGSRQAARFSENAISNAYNDEIPTVDKETLAFYIAVRVWDHFVNGRFNEALEEIANIKKSLGQIDFLQLYRIPLIQTLMEKGDIDEAKKDLKVATDFIESHDLQAHNVMNAVFLSLFACEVGIESCDPEMYEISHTKLCEIENILNEKWVTGCRLRAEALELADHGDNENAVSKFKESSSIWKGLGIVFWEGKDLLSLSSVYAKMKNNTEANNCLNEAIELFTAHDASYFVEKALSNKELLKA